MPLNTTRRPSRYSVSRRGGRGGRGASLGSSFDRAPGVLPPPMGGGTSGIVSPLSTQAGMPTSLAAQAKAVPMQTVQNLSLTPGGPPVLNATPGPSFGLPTSQIPQPPFPGAAYAGGNGTYNFWQDPTTGSIRVFVGTQEMATPAQRTANVLPAAPSMPAAAPPVQQQQSGVNGNTFMGQSAPAAGAQPAPATGQVVPTAQFAGGVAPSWLAAALAGQVVSFDAGGVVPEMVVGIGMQTGLTYKIAGKGPEQVTPPPGQIDSAPLTQPGY